MLGELGQRVLLVDMDPQAMASIWAGIEEPRHGSAKDTYAVLIDRVPIGQAARESFMTRVDVVAASQRMNGIDRALMSDLTPQMRLKRALDGLDAWDYVVLDCPPGLTLLAANALLASDAIVIPTQASSISLDGVRHFLDTLTEFRDASGLELQVLGVLLCCVDRRRLNDRRIERDTREALGGVVFETVIPQTVRMMEAYTYQMPITSYDEENPGAVAYRELAIELLERDGVPVDTPLTA